jgi:hypothetical protein
VQRVQQCRQELTGAAGQLEKRTRALFSKHGIIFLKIINNRKPEQPMSTGRQITDTELLLVRMDLEELAEWLGFKGNKTEADDDSKYAFVRTIMKQLKGLSACDWTSVEYDRILSVTRRKNIGRPMRIRGSMRALENVAPCYTLEDALDTAEAELMDSSGDFLRTCPVADPELLDKMQTLFGGYQSFDFYGTIVPAVPKNKTAKNPVFKFFLVDVEPSENPLQMVYATPGEIEEAAAVVAKYSGEHGGIQNYIREQLIQIIGIKGLEDAPELDRSLSFMILQALSDGYDARRSLSHKLHSLVIGSPAVGKKLLSEAAYILNPVYTEGHPAKVTVAGIAGKAVKRDGVWTSDPGLIPLAHRGIFVIQDFHHVKRKTEIMGVLSMTMEDGRVIDSTAANKEHHALTSIHIDMNKASHLLLTQHDVQDNAQSRLADLGVTMNVVTRFDFITEIPRDTERQMGIALQMHTGGQRTVKFPGKRKHSIEARRLQVLVAYLRVKYEEIVIPDDLAENYIRGKQEELMQVNSERLSERTLLGDYQTRLSNSIHKLTFAIARANARDTANKADVDEAFRYVHTKMDFLSTIEPFLVPTTWNEGPQLDKVKKRQEFIRIEFAGKEVSVEEVHAAVSQKYDQHVSTTTIRRDLKELGEPVRHGVFKICDDHFGEMAK